MILFGALFAIFEKPGRGGTVFSSHYFWRGVVFTTLFNIAVFDAIIAFPDWMWMYFLENSTNTCSELIYIFVFLYYLPYTLGFYLGYDFRSRSVVLWFLLLVVMLLAEAWLIYTLFDRYSVVGTRAQYLSGTAVSLFSKDNPIGPVMNACVAAMVLYFMFVVYQYRKGGRKSLSL